MKLLKIEFSNMFSYGLENNVLKLDENPITQLTAVNGVGKSSIALILQEILYNKNIKGIKKGDIVNRYVASKNYSGKVTFSKGADTYEVSVKRNGATSKVTFIKNGSEDLTEHKVLDTYKKIENVIGRDFEVFSQLTYQSSIDILDFLVATDTNRKKFLINLFNLEKYINIGETIKLKVNALEKDLLLKQGELSGVKNFLETTKIPDKIIKVEIPELDESNIDEINNLKNFIKNHNSLSIKIEENNIRKTECEKLKFDIGLKEPEKPNDVYIKYKESKTALDIALSNLSTVESKLKHLDLADHCEVCKQPIDNTQQLQIKTNLEQEKLNILLNVAAYKTDLIYYEDIIKEYEKDLKLFQTNNKTKERFEVLFQLIDNTLPSSIENVSESIIKLKQLETEYKGSVNVREKLLEHNESVKIHNAKVDLLIEQKRNFLARQHLLDNDILTLSQQIKNLVILRKAFSTTGIVAFKLENLTKELENTINYYLAELSDGQFQVEFRLDGEKLNIIVVNNGIESPVETVSGGEFSRIQTAILLAIRNVLSKLGSDSINLLFLDEITGVLDDSGKEKLVEVLLKEEDLNVFLISHDFQHPLIPKINIVKTKNISKIE